MAKSIKKRRIQGSSNLHPADKALTKMRYVDLKIACISLGMPFKEVVNGYWPTLRAYFRENYFEIANPERVHEFDKWVAKKLKKRGAKDDDPILLFSLGTVLKSTEGDGGLEKRKKRNTSKAAKLNVVKKTRKRVEKKYGITKGTKKYWVYLGVNKNFSESKILAKLKKEFPGETINDKSVKIWMRRAQKYFRDQA